MNANRLCILFLISALASGCSSLSANLSQNQNATTPLKVAEGQSRIYIYRTDEFSLYGGESTFVKIDNIEMGKFGYNDFKILDVPSGQHALHVSSWVLPGNCTFASKFEPNTEYYFEVRPQLTNFVKIPVAIMILAPLANILPTPLIALGAIGVGASTSDVCGPYSIAGVERGQAEEAIEKIKVFNAVQ